MHKKTAGLVKAKSAQTKMTRSKEPVHWSSTLSKSAPEIAVEMAKDQSQQCNRPSPWIKSLRRKAKAQGVPCFFSSGVALMLSQAPTLSLVAVTLIPEIPPSGGDHLNLALGGCPKTLENISSERPMPTAVAHPDCETAKQHRNTVNDTQTHTK